MQNPGSWGIRFECSGVEVQGARGEWGEVRGVLGRVSVLPVLFLVLLGLPSLPKIGRANHTAVRFLSFPISAKRWNLL